MSRRQVTSKASSLPLLTYTEQASIRPTCRTRPPWLRKDAFDPAGLSFARLSTTKFWAVVAILTVFAALFAPVLL